MDEFRQSDELVAERDVYEAEQEMKNRKFRARCIQWDKTDDDGTEVEDALAVYLTDYYGFCHNGFFFEEVED